MIRTCLLLIHEQCILTFKIKKNETLNRRKKSWRIPKWKYIFENMLLDQLKQESLAEGYKHNARRNEHTTFHKNRKWDLVLLTDLHIRFINDIRCEFLFHQCLIFVHFVRNWKSNYIWHSHNENLRWLTISRQSYKKL